MDPLISIITPCYNSQEYIGRYLDSIIKQTYKKIHLILVDDGSTDNTKRVIKSYMDSLVNEGIIVTYDYQENKGIGSAVNLGLKHIRGEYFTWCDSDNFFAANYLERCVKFINSHKDCDILRCDAYTVLEGKIDTPINRFSDGNTEKHKRYLFVNAIMEKNFHFGCALLKTSAFDKVVKDREIYESRAGQNWQLLLPMLYEYEADYIDEPLFYFVQREDSLSNLVNWQGLQEKIDRVQEHEKILLETIRRIEFESEKYIKMVREKYIRIRLKIAFEHKNRELIERYYYDLKKIGNVKLKERLYFLCSKNSTTYCICKILYLSLRGIGEIKRILL